MSRRRPAATATARNSWRHSNICVRATPWWSGSCPLWRVVPETDHRIAHDLEQKPQALEVLTHNIDTRPPEGRLFLGPFTQRYVMGHRSPQNLGSALGAQSCQLRRPSANLWRPSEGPDEHPWSKGETALVSGLKPAPIMFSVLPEWQGA